MREPPALDRSLRTGAPRPRYALLVNPFYPKDPHASYGKHILTPTLALTSFAGATPPDWAVRYWDENLLQGPPPSQPFPQVVAITVHLTFARRAFELARWFRDRGSKVIFGGLHVLSCPEECAPHADALVTGEGAQVWPEVLRDVEARALKPLYRGSYLRPYRDDPPPCRELLDRRAFLTTTSINATRGCHNRCGFCYLSTDGLQVPYQCRDVGQVAAEVEADGQPYFVFTDNNLGSRPAYLRELCRALRPLDRIWSAAVTLDVTDDPSLVREMALAGCTGVFIGFESLTDANITDSRKKSPRAADYAARVRVFHDHGIQVNGSFVLGFDHDRADCFERLVDWIEGVRMESATYHVLTPYPGTPLFRQMEAEGRLLHRDWSLYDTAHVVFRPKHMTPEQLAAGYEYCYDRTFSHRCIWRRRPRDWRAVPAYLAMAYLYKKANRLWPFLIRHRLTHWVWRPLLEVSRLRHLRFRRRLEEQTPEVCSVRVPVYAGV
jgi:radical SAM superfamily enzyme YgiQ (UPF0313 family)